MRQATAILLAAGASSRFGTDKLLHPLADGEPIGVRAARNLIDAVPDTLAVVRQGDRDLIGAFTDLGLRVIENPWTDRGMGTSLALGVKASSEADGWLIALADMPWVQPITIGALADELRNGASLVAPAHDGRRGHPVGFAARWRTQLEALTGDQGARNLLVAHASELLLQPTNDLGILLDVDTRADLEGL